MSVSSLGANSIEHVAYVTEHGGKPVLLRGAAWLCQHWGLNTPEGQADLSHFPRRHGANTPLLLSQGLFERLIGGAAITSFSPRELASGLPDVRYLSLRQMAWLRTKLPPTEACEMREARRLCEHIERCLYQGLTEEATVARELRPPTGAPVVDLGKTILTTLGFCLELGSDFQAETWEIPLPAGSTSGAETAFLDVKRLVLSQHADEAVVVYAAKHDKGGSWEIICDSRQGEHGKDGSSSSLGRKTELAMRSPGFNQNLREARKQLKQSPAKLVSKDSEGTDVDQRSDAGRSDTSSIVKASPREPPIRSEKLGSEKTVRELARDMEVVPRRATEPRLDLSYWQQGQKKVPSRATVTEAPKPQNRRSLVKTAAVDAPAGVDDGWRPLASSLAGSSSKFSPGPGCPPGMSPEVYRSRMQAMQNECSSLSDDAQVLSEQAHVVMQGLKDEVQKFQEAKEVLEEKHKSELQLVEANNKNKLEKSEGHSIKLLAELATERLTSRATLKNHAILCHELSTERQKADQIQIGWEAKLAAAKLSEHQLAENICSLEIQRQDQNVDSKQSDFDVERLEARIVSIESTESCLFEQLSSMKEQRASDLHLLDPNFAELRKQNVTQHAELVSAHEHSQHLDAEVEELKKDQARQLISLRKAALMADATSGDKACASDSQLAAQDAAVMALSSKMHAVEYDCAVRVDHLDEELSASRAEYASSEKERRANANEVVQLRASLKVMESRDADRANDIAKGSVAHMAQLCAARAHNQVMQESLHDLEQKHAALTYAVQATENVLRKPSYNDQGIYFELEDHKRRLEEQHQEMMKMQSKLSLPSSAGLQSQRETRHVLAKLTAVRCTQDALRRAHLEISTSEIAASRARCRDLDFQVGQLSETLGDLESYVEEIENASPSEHGQPEPFKDSGDREASPSNAYMQERLEGLEEELVRTEELLERQKRKTIDASELRSQALLLREEHAALSSKRPSSKAMKEELELARMSEESSKFEAETLEARFESEVARVKRIEGELNASTTNYSKLEDAEKLQECTHNILVQECTHNLQEHEIYKQKHHRLQDFLKSLEEEHVQNDIKTKQKYATEMTAVSETTKSAFAVEKGELQHELAQSNEALEAAKESEMKLSTLVSLRSAEVQEAATWQLDAARLVEVHEQETLEAKHRLRVVESQAVEFENFQQSMVNRIELRSQERMEELRNQLSEERDADELRVIERYRNLEMNNKASDRLTADAQEELRRKLLDAETKALIAEEVLNNEQGKVKDLMDLEQRAFVSSEDMKSLNQHRKRQGEEIAEAHARHLSLERDCERLVADSQARVDACRAVAAEELSKGRAEAEEEAVEKDALLAAAHFEQVALRDECRLRTAALEAVLAEERARRSNAEFVTQQIPQSPEKQIQEASVIQLPAEVDTLQADTQSRSMVDETATQELRALREESQVHSRAEEIFKNDVKVLQSENESLSAELQEMETAKIDLASKSHEMRIELHKYEAEVDAVRQEAETIQDEQERMEQANELQNALASTRSAERINFQEEITSLQSEIAVVQQELHATRNREAQPPAQEEISSLRSEVVAVQEELYTSREMEAQYPSHLEITSLRNEVAAVQEELYAARNGEVSSSSAIVVKNPGQIMMRSSLRTCARRKQQGPSPMDEPVLVDELGRLRTEVAAVDQLRENWEARAGEKSLALENAESKLSSELFHASNLAADLSTEREGHRELRTRLAAEAAQYEAAALDLDADDTPSRSSSRTKALQVPTSHGITQTSGDSDEISIADYQREAVEAARAQSEVQILSGNLYAVKEELHSAILEREVDRDKAWKAQESAAWACAAERGKRRAVGLELEDARRRHCTALVRGLALARELAGERGRAQDIAAELGFAGQALGNAEELARGSPMNTVRSSSPMTRSPSPTDMQRSPTALSPTLWSQTMWSPDQRNSGFSSSVSSWSPNGLSGQASSLLGSRGNLQYNNGLTTQNAGLATGSTSSRLLLPSSRR